MVLDSEMVTSIENQSTISQAGAPKPISKPKRIISELSTPLRKPIDRASSTRLHYIGRPGSRRYQRYLNRSYLLEKESNIISEDLLVFNPTITPLSKLLLDPENRKEWEPFRSVSEEKQEQLLQSLKINSSHNSEGSQFELSSKRVESASERFRSIDRKCRKILKKTTITDYEFFYDLEQEITQFIKNDCNNTDDHHLLYSFDCTYHRMICHGICQYYKLDARSKNNRAPADCTSNNNSNNNDDDNVNRIVVIKKKETTNIPNETLSGHLQNIRNRNSIRQNNNEGE